MELQGKEVGATTKEKGFGDREVEALLLWSSPFGGASRGSMVSENIDR